MTLVSRNGIAIRCKASLAKGLRRVHYNITQVEPLGYIRLDGINVEETRETTHRLG